MIKNSLVASGQKYIKEVVVIVINPATLPGNRSQSGIDISKSAVIVTEYLCDGIWLVVATHQNIKVSVVIIVSPCNRSLVGTG